MVNSGRGEPGAGAGGRTKNEMITVKIKESWG